MHNDIDMLEIKISMEPIGIRLFSFNFKDVKLLFFDLYMVVFQVYNVLTPSLAFMHWR